MDISKYSKELVDEIARYLKTVKKSDWNSPATIKEITRIVKTDLAKPKEER
jgi:hypothetical protein